MLVQTQFKHSVQPNLTQIQQYNIICKITWSDTRDEPDSKGKIAVTTILGSKDLCTLSK